MLRKTKGMSYKFKKKSVGATGNIIMAAVGAEGQPQYQMHLVSQKSKTCVTLYHYSVSI